MRDRAREQRRAKVSAALGDGHAQSYRIRQGQIAVHIGLARHDPAPVLDVHGGWCGMIECGTREFSLPFIAPLDEPPISERSLDAVVIGHVHDALRGPARRGLFQHAYRWLKGGGAVIVVGIRRWGPLGMAATVGDLRGAGFEAFRVSAVVANPRLRKLLSRLPEGMIVPFAAGYVLLARKPQDPGNIIDARKVIGQRRVGIGKPVATRIASGCR